ncbi:hypothetical protein H4R99_001186 [Coemansia sp. RSA 1722]|nr:hypothetical protein H4R99_001186 [Coemansia sp. RSA 1722]KAJ2638376.1 hypothetical protein GGF40_001695 [Coemansia sp. RSA 1286]
MDAAGDVLAEASVDRVSLQWMRLANAVLAANSSSSSADKDDGTAGLLDFGRLVVVRLADCSNTTAVVLAALFALRLASNVFDFLSAPRRRRSAAQKQRCL